MGIEIPYSPEFSDNLAAPSVIYHEWSEQFNLIGGVELTEAAP